MEQAAAVSATQQKLIRFAQNHDTRAEARDEGDVAVFCDAVTRDGRLVTEIEVVQDMASMRAVLGY